jgi:hypothetical protein
MEVFEMPEVPGMHTAGNRPEIRVTKRWMLWVNYGLPLLLATCLASIGIRLAGLSWNDLWNGSLTGDEAEKFQMLLETFLAVPFLFGYFLILNRNWFLNRICRYRIEFGPEGKVYCSNPELLTALSPAAFLGTQMLPYTESAVYKTDAASRPLAIRGTFANMAAWADWRFGADALREALRQVTFPRHLQTTRETLSVLWFLYWSGAYICLNLAVPFAIGLFAGLPGPFPWLGAASVLVAGLIASAYLFFTACTRVALTADCLEFRRRFRTKSIPFDIIKEVRLWSNGFTVVYAKGRAERRAHIGQARFSESLLPLYLSLCSRIPRARIAKGDTVALSATGVPVP